MSIRILGGSAKGRILAVPQSDLVRPTSVMLRRKVFDAHQDLSDRVFFDVCAGSGSMGLEAWSRGASEVYFVEPNRKHFSVLEENISRCASEAENIYAMNMSFETWLRHFHSHFPEWKESKQKNSILFFDPPYGKENLYDLFSDELIETKWFPGELWIQSDEKKGVPLKFFTDKGINPRKIFSQGDNFILITRLVY